jgi:hypothetical protein
VVDEIEDTETDATDLVPSRGPVLGLAPGLVLCHLQATDAGVVPLATRMCATVIHSVEEEGSVVVVLLEGSVTITIALHALVRVLVPRLVVVDQGHFLPGDAHLVTPEVDMAAEGGQGVTRCVRVGHVRGHTLDRGLAPCHIRVIRDIREARLVAGPSAEEGEPGAEAEAEMTEMTSETAGRDRRGSRQYNLPSIVLQNQIACV